MSSARGLHEILRGPLPSAGFSAIVSRYVRRARKPASLADLEDAKSRLQTGPAERMVSRLSPVPQVHLLRQDRGRIASRPGCDIIPPVSSENFVLVPRTQ
eukprot:scaffold307773_cov41-Prasinocladus_malaysianus.AAC.1